MKISANMARPKALRLNTAAHTYLGNPRKVWINIVHSTREKADIELSPCSNENGWKVSSGYVSLGRIITTLQTLWNHDEKYRVVDVIPNEGKLLITLELGIGEPNEYVTCQ